MRAGVARSAAITSERSSIGARLERSTMRYWTVLLSGTAGLGKQGLDRAERVPRAPVALAEGGVAHAPLGVDEEGHRQPARVPGRRGLLVRVQQHRQRDAITLQER